MMRNGVGLNLREDITWTRYISVDKNFSRGMKAAPEIIRLLVICLLHLKYVHTG